MKIVMFIIIMLAVVLGANLYVVYRLWNMIPAGGPWRWMLAGFVVLAVGAFFISMLLRNSMPFGITTFLYRLGTAWFFIMLYLVMTLLVLDLVRVTHLLPAVAKYMHGSWAGFAAVVGFVAIIMVAGNIKYHSKTRVELPLVVEKPLPRDIRIVAASDLHIGYGIGKKELARWVEAINAEDPDVILFAGDVIDNSPKPLIEKDFASELRKLRARHGVYAALGNHEYISGAAESVAFLESAGVTVLRDSAAMIDSLFYVVGRDDRTNPHRRTLAELTAPLDSRKAVVVLDHQPYELDAVVDAGADLQISGHTHRGQVWPISWITDAMYEVAHGYKHKGDTHFYVSSGLGLWGGKFRIGTRSEYLVVTLSSPK